MNVLPHYYCFVPQKAVCFRWIMLLIKKLEQKLTDVETQVKDAFKELESIKSIT